jgi:hypothetical protein
MLFREVEEWGAVVLKETRQGKIMEFENDFFTVLEKVQTNTDLIPDDFVIRDECGIARKIRRSGTQAGRDHNEEDWESVTESVTRTGKVLVLHFLLKRKALGIELRSPVESLACPKFQRLCCDLSGQWVLGSKLYT